MANTSPPTTHGPLEHEKKRIADLEAVVGDQALRLQGLVRIAANLTASREPRKAMAAIVNDISALLRADRTTIYELRQGEGLLRGLAVQGSGHLEVGIPLGRGIAGQVALYNRAINLKDAYQHPQFDPKFDKLTGYRTRSMLCVPMRNPKQEVIGVVQVMNRKGGYFTVEDEGLLSALATQAAITLEALRLQLALNVGNAELRTLSNQLSQKVSELELLYGNERSFSEAETYTELAERILKVVAQVVGCEFAAFYLPDDTGLGPVWLGASDETVGLRHFSRVAVGDGVVGRVASRGRSVNLSEPGEFVSVDIPQQLFQGAPVTLRDVLGAPLLDGDETIGSLVLANLTGGQSRDNEADLQLAVILAAQISRAVLRIRQRQDAQQNDRLLTIGQMLSSVLHDLKGPMTVISGYSQLMAQTDDPEERAEMSSSIRRQVSMFNDMTREVMAFVRGERRVFARKVFMRQFVAAVCEVMNPEFEGSPCSFTVENQSKNKGYFDERKIMRVVTNIIRNARQAMTDGGRVIWRITDVDEGGLLFRIEDNGPGIPESIRETLFDAFTTSGKAEGTGLGLAIVRRIVEDHGGSVAFTTKTGVGTCFSIRLPGAPEETKPPY